KLGRRKATHNRLVRTIASKRVGYFDVTSAEYRARCSCVTGSGQTGGRRGASSSLARGSGHSGGHAMLVLLAAALLGFDDGPARDLDKVQGTWTAVCWEYGGAAKTKETGLRIRCEIKDFNVTMRDDQGGSCAMRITNFDPTAEPHRVM